MKLERIITDSKLAWGDTLNFESQRKTLSNASFEELKSLFIETNNQFDLYTDMSRFPLKNLRREINRLREEFIDHGPGFVVVSGLSETGFNEEMWIMSFICISRLLGKLIPQDKDGALIREVKDRGGKIEAKGRYSETKFGGSLHTDGIAVPSPYPTYLPLLCLSKAKKGGKTLLISAYTIHNMLLQNKPEILARLYENFYWDRRGFLGPNGEKTFVKPVFSYDGKQLSFRYLKEYIEEGYKIAKVSIKNQDVQALQSVDELLNDESNMAQGTLNPGDFLISNNIWTIHGRTTFEDYEEEARKRRYLRLWVLRK